MKSVAGRYTKGIVNSIRCRCLLLKQIPSGNVAFPNASVPITNAHRFDLTEAASQSDSFGRGYRQVAHISASLAVTSARRNGSRFWSSLGIYKSGACSVLTYVRLGRCLPVLYACVYEHLSEYWGKIH